MLIFLYLKYSEHLIVSPGDSALAHAQDSVALSTCRWQQNKSSRKRGVPTGEVLAVTQHIIVSCFIYHVAQILTLTLSHNPMKPLVHYTTVIWLNNLSATASKPEEEQWLDVLMI